METATAYPASFDAYLRFAIETRFSYFGGSDDLVLILLVRLKQQPDERLQVFEEDLRSLHHPFALGPMWFEDAGMRPASASLTLRVLASFAMDPETWSFWDKWACWVTLSMLKLPGLPGSTFTVDSTRAISQSQTVVAVIDDGCPFAHERFRVDAGSTHSRVLAIWDQNPPDPSEVGVSAAFGKLPGDFGIGREYRRSWAASPQIGIDDWIAMHLLPGGSVDEDACYREAGLQSLRHRISHGAHVIDTLAGRVPPSARLSFDPEKPPSFQPKPALAGDVAGQGATDIVFVQIPRTAVDDPTGVWLEGQMKEALYYIMSCINPANTKRVIVNLSYGPTTGPHDGKSNLEYVISAFTKHFNGTPGKPELSVFLPSGNSRLRDWHLSFTSTSTDMTRRWTWRVPPDNPVWIFAEIWVPPAQAGAVSGLLIAPVPAAAYTGPQPVITQAEAPCSDSHGWLIALPPTQAAPGIAAPGPHGDWTIQLTLTDPGVEVHAYIARSDPNMGARLPAKPTRFLDPKWEGEFGARARQTNQDGAWDITGSLLDRKGTINGGATAKDKRVLVASGYRLNDDVCSRYSSRGPGRTTGARKGPDQAMPTDEAPALPGIRAAGNRSGAVFRLVGTSTASPQLARRQASTSPLPQCTAPNADVGCGKQPAP